MSIGNIQSPDSLFPASGGNTINVSLSNIIQYAGINQSGSLSYTGWTGNYSLYLLTSNPSNSQLKGLVMLLLVINNLTVASTGTGGTGTGPQINFNDSRMYFKTYFVATIPNQGTSSSVALGITPAFTNNVITGIILNSPNAIASSTYESYLLIGV